MLIGALVIFLGWRFLSGGGSFLGKIGGSSAVAAPVISSVVPAALPVNSVVAPTSLSTSAPTVAASLGVVSTTDSVATAAVETSNFMDDLLKHSRPRLSLTIQSKDSDFQGSVDFYQGTQLVERYNIPELHALGASLIRTPYGVNLLYRGKSYLLTAWVLPTANTNN
jgi:hypothetical protein